jgi:hypothetical protein
LEPLDGSTYCVGRYEVGGGVVVFEYGKKYNKKVVFKGKKTVKAASVTKDDIDVMLKLAELYNTSYDFDAAEWLWD